MAKHCDNNADVDIEGRAEFVRENAMALLAERDAKIKRLRDVIRRLEKVNKSLRIQLKKN